MGRIAGLQAGLDAAKRYVEHLQEYNLRLERMLAACGAARQSSDRDLVAERTRRKEAEARWIELQAELDQETATREALETQLADLEVEKRALERRVDNVISREAQLEDETTGWDDDATRRRVLRVQATRARLAKTDMSPSARLRTLRQADGYGIDLTRRQRAELDELEEQLGDDGG